MAEDGGRTEPLSGRVSAGVSGWGLVLLPRGSCFFKAGFHGSHSADWCHAAAPAQCVLDLELSLSYYTVTVSRVVCSALSPENAQRNRSCVPARIAQKYTRETRIKRVFLRDDVAPSEITPARLVPPETRGRWMSVKCVCSVSSLQEHPSSITARLKVALMGH
ncbi:hypothetical protein NQZ68_023730 [Dissostichus eleginoides]|nr:hypothetical protein NQZ68_023730 [Dissostichus eleginoides]